MMKTLKWLLLVLCLTTSAASADELKEYLSTFIEPTCCYTNSCCWAIKPSEVTDLGNGQYKINSTGQEIERKDFSPDGKYWRCACDYEGAEKGWVKHEKANTRCLYTPRMSY